jgi:hypothetical protein
LSKKVKIKAAPGRILLEFPVHPDEEVEMESGLFRPAVYTQIPEIATVIDVGEPLDEEERKYATYFRERQERGEGVLADYGAGQSFFRERTDPAKWGWLKPIRSYRLSSPSAHLEVTEVEG